MPQSGGPIVCLHRFLKFSNQKYNLFIQDSPSKLFGLDVIFKATIFLLRNRCKLIHISGLGREGFYIIIAAKIARVPHIVTTIHGTHRDLLFSTGWKKFITVNFLEEITLRLTDYISVVAEVKLSEVYLQKYSSKIIGFFPNGIDTLENNKKTRTAQEAYSSGVIRVLFLSRVTREKGVEIFLEALKKLNKVDIGIKLDVSFVGFVDDFFNKESVLKSFRSSDRINVTFYGNQSDVSIFYRENDLFVFPSLHENFPNVILEAMSYGMPIIATDVGDVKSMLSPNGGKIIPASDSDCLAEMLVSLVQDPDLMHSLGASALDIVRHRYDIRDVVSKWEILYKLIIR